jgi:hypothetical protein
MKRPKLTTPWMVTKFSRLIKNSTTAPIARGSSQPKETKCFHVQNEEARSSLRTTLDLRVKPSILSKISLNLNTKATERTTSGLSSKSRHGPLKVALITETKSAPSRSKLLTTPDSSCFACALSARHMRSSSKCTRTRTSGWTSANLRK